MKTLTTEIYEKGDKVKSNDHEKRPGTIQKVKTLTIHGILVMVDVKVDWGDKTEWVFPETIRLDHEPSLPS